MPSAPCDNTVGISSGNSIFAPSSTLCPSVVSAGRFFISRRFLSSLISFFCNLRYWSNVLLLGFTYTMPFSPSTSMVSPFLTFPVIFSRPTTAGISRDFAIIAVWEVFPPISDTKAITFFLCIVAVSLGERSYATTTDFGGILARVRLFLPSKFLRSLLPTSSISVIRSLRYSSSIF